MATGDKLVTLDGLKAAYDNEMSIVANDFSTQGYYYPGDYVIYEGSLYLCIAAHEAAAWNADHFQQTSVTGELNGQNGILNQLTHYCAPASYTPTQLSAIAASGAADRYFSPGDIITIPWTDRSGDSDAEYQYPFIVVDIAEAEDADGNIHENALWLQSIFATPNQLPFYTKNRVEVNLTTEPTAINGWYYVGVSGTDYTKLDLSTGDTIPTTYDYVYRTIYNVPADTAVQFGIARWKTSAIRQWLNSTALKNEGWWEAQENGDVAPSDSYNNLPGFFGGFDADWRDIFKAPKISTRYFPSKSSGTYTVDVTVDKVFLPSRINLYAATRNTEQSYWAYWVTAIGDSSPSAASNDARIMRSINNPSSDAVGVWTRDMQYSYPARPFYITSAGAVDAGNTTIVRYYRTTPCLCLF